MRYQITAAIIRGLLMAILPLRPTARRSIKVLLAGGFPGVLGGVFLACLLPAPASSIGAQQRLDPELPGRGVVAALGVRDAGDLGTAWLGALGLRFPLVRRVNVGLTASRASVEVRECPATPGLPCPSGGWVAGLDLDLELYYGRGMIYPYGVVSVGAGHLSLPDADFRSTAFAYSTGLGLGAHVGPRVWLLLEGRWRQESFEDYSAHGVMAVLGARLGF